MYRQDVGLADMAPAVPTSRAGHFRLTFLREKRIFQSWNAWIFELSA